MPGSVLTLRDNPPVQKQKMIPVVLGTVIGLGLPAPAASAEPTPPEPCPQWFVEPNCSDLEGGPYEHCPCKCGA